MIRSALLALVLVLSGPVAAQDAAQGARDAAARIADAVRALDEADGAQDRVAALTQTVRAFEDGLTALRAGLRGVTIREMELTRALAAREGETARLLAALMTIGRQEGPATTLHPDGPLGTARAGMMVAALTPALAAGAAELRRELEEVHTLRQVQEAAAQRLEDGLSGIQQARTELSQAVADRTDLPRRFTADPVRTAILISAADTLDAFAGGLSQISNSAIPATDADITARKGTLPLPAAGQVLRKAGQADAAGVARPGIVLATAPLALVTTPVPATIRYRGPLLNYGEVVILEPQQDMLFVLAGLGTVYGAIGEVLPEGSPVGLMGGQLAQTAPNASQSGDRAGAGLSETLYIEVRQGETPVDPLTWFTTDKG